MKEEAESRKKEEGGETNTPLGDQTNQKKYGRQRDASGVIERKTPSQKGPQRPPTSKQTCIGWIDRIDRDNNFGFA